MTNWLILFEITKTHLLSRFKQTSIAALGVTFGIGTFIILVSFMTGLNGLLDGLVLNRTPHIRVYNEVKPSNIQPIESLDQFRNAFNIIKSIKPKQNQTRIHDALPLISSLRADSRVRGVSPQVSTPAFYLAGAIELNGVINGIEVAEENRLFHFDDYIVEGSHEALSRNRNGILLGAGIAEKMLVSVGDRIQVSTAKGGVFPLKVVGLFQSGLGDIDNVQSYVNLQMAQQLIGQGNDYISDINIKLWDMNISPTMAQELTDITGLSSKDIFSANAQFDTGTSIRNLITYAVSITLLLVAGFGIYNILNMMIYEKMNDIAILKATGFSGSDVQKIFISQAMIIGIIGGIIGLGLGYIVSVLISHVPFETDALPTIKTYPVNFDSIYYIIGIVFAIISTFLAGFLPSRKAKNIDPVRIIRGQ